MWVTPNHANVDIALIGINANQLRETGIHVAYFQSDNHLLTLEQARESGLSEGDGVFALGFPMGLVGEQRNYVIVRQGCIARVRDALVGATDDILVDVAVFPGNSGGPLVTRPEVTAIQGTKAFQRAALLGVVRGYVPYQEVAVSEQTGEPRVIFTENSGLASVVPIDEVVRLAEAYNRTAAQKETGGSPDTTPPKASPA